MIMKLMAGLAEPFHSLNICCADGQKEEPVICGHTESAVGHEELPHGPDPDPRPAPLLLHGCDRRGQAHPDRMPGDTGSSVTRLQNMNSLQLTLCTDVHSDQDDLTLFWRSKVRVTAASCGPDFLKASNLRSKPLIIGHFDFESVVVF